MTMYIERVKNRNSPPAVLLRESFREEGKVRKRTVANLSGLPAQTLEAMRAALQGQRSFENLPEAFEVERTLPHGHVAAILGTLRNLGLERVLAAKRSRCRDLVVAMIVARIAKPDSKLATAKGLGPETLKTSLPELLDVEGADEDELYEALDWLVDQKETIERKLADKHLRDGDMALYDVSSSYYEGRTCPLIAFGYNRDGKLGKKQINWGLLTNRMGCPVAIAVYAGNRADPTTVRDQVRKLKDQFGMERVVLVGDRGMLTKARIDETLRAEEGLGWVTALGSASIRRLVRSGQIQMSMFEDQELGEIESPELPGERLVGCRNARLTEERRANREQLLQRTEKDLQKVARAVHRKRRPLRGEKEISLRVGEVLNQHRMKKHFCLEVTDSSFSYHRDEARIREEAALDGLYGVRASRAETADMEPGEVVETYKGLSRVERAFRTMKGVEIKIRPIEHRLEKRVRGHMVLCMLAYYVEWHMRRALAPVLYDDEQEDWARAQADRSSAVAPAVRSGKARSKEKAGENEDGIPVQKFPDLLEDLGTVARNRIRPRGTETKFEKTTELTELQAKALELLGVRC